VSPTSSVTGLPPTSWGGGLSLPPSSVLTFFGWGVLGGGPRALPHRRHGCPHVCGEGASLLPPSFDTIVTHLFAVITLEGATSH